MIDTQALRAAAEAATPGPWRWVAPTSEAQWGNRGPCLAAPDGGLVISAEGDADGVHLYASGADANYLEAVDPQDILTLLDELDGLRARLGE